MNSLSLLLIGLLALGSSIWSYKHDGIDGYTIISGAVGLFITVGSVLALTGVVPA